ncbi:MAG TPA: tripartite tricarboxylate transporter substrate binding protein [Lacipirellulaceae bacterium]|nr:tripartite tricarboxylate transporter substrate binding protein [Lacipirellulaceae bacterium]
MADTYPSRPVHLLVGYAPGGGNDIAARLMAQWLSQRLGQSFVVENRPGAGSNLATETVVNARPDGYTLLLVNPANAVNATLYDKLNFNFLHDIKPVAGISKVPAIIVVNPSLAAKTVPELIAYAKANPGKSNYATGGIGTESHMAGELFKMMAGVDLVTVNYRGTAPAIAALLGGQVEVSFPSVPAAIEQVKAGKLRALGVGGATRSELLPNVPTVGEFVPGYEASTWYGLGVAKNAPTEIVDKLNREVNAAFADPVMKMRLAELSGTLLAGAPADFGKFVADETEKWGKVIRAANIKLQ